MIYVVIINIGDYMIFDDLRAKEICNILHYTPQKTHFVSRNKKEHIIGIKLSGKAEHFFKDRKFNLCENMIYFFNKDEDYEVNVLEKSLAYSVHFTTYEPIETQSFCLKINDTSEVLRTLEKIETVFKASHKTNAKALKEFYKLASLYEDIYVKKYSPKNNNLLRAREYINLNFKDKDCIINATEISGVSNRRFNDLFKENFNITPNQYIINLKIELAKNLLRLGEISVSGVSELCGISDIYYFSKLFKKETGFTPSEYRKQI